MDDRRAAPSHHRLWEPGTSDAHSRTAICVAGELRSAPATTEGFIAAVLQPLAPASLFMHVSAEWNAARGAQGARTTSKALHDLVRKLKPVSLQLMDDDRIPMNRTATTTSRRYSSSSDSPPGCAFADWPLGSCPTLLMRWAGCAMDIERHEQERKLRYSFVVRTRPDLRWECRLPALPQWAGLSNGQPAAVLFRDLFGLYERDVGIKALRLRERVALRSKPCREPYPLDQAPELNVCLPAVLHEAHAHVCSLKGYGPFGTVERSAAAVLEAPESECRVCEPSKRLRLTNATVDDREARATPREPIRLGGRP